MVARIEQALFYRVLTPNTHQLGETHAALETPCYGNHGKSVKEKGMARDKEETKAKILQAVGKLLAESGFKQLGVNAIAREAGIDKVLIYRYFENLPSLLQAFGQESDYWITAQELFAQPEIATAESLADCMVHILQAIHQDLHQHPISQEILRWELLEANELTHELAALRDRTANTSLATLGDRFTFPDDVDVPAISAILVAGIVYLTLRTKLSPTFMGIDFSTPEGWKRIEAAAELLLGRAIGDEGMRGQGV
jgi:AcrR family transcriptional regulator